MTLSPATRESILQSFDGIRPAFLAALDQVIAEMSSLMAIPGFQESSVLAAADVFADPEMLKEQVFRARPSWISQLPEEDIHQAHLLSVAYLLSLSLHETMKRRQEGSCV